MKPENHSIGSFHLNESLAYTGGAEGYILDLATALGNSGVPVRLGAGRTEDVALPGISYVIPRVHKMTDGDHLMGQVEMIREIMENEGLEIIHLHSIDNPQLYGQLATSFPIVRTVHDSRVVCPVEFRVDRAGQICTAPLGNQCLTCPDGGVSTVRLEGKRGTLAALNSLDLVLTPSSYMKNQLVGNGVNPDKVEILPLFVPLGLEPLSSIDQPHTSDILFIGRVAKYKGLRQAIESVSKLTRPFRFIVCGDGPDLETCRRMTVDLGVADKIKFVGWVDKAEKSKYLAGTSMVVVPSMYPESFCLVGLEAMHYRKPVVAFDAGGVCEWLRDKENGFLIERGNIDQMAGALSTLLASGKIRSDFGDRGQKIANSEFTLELHLQKLMGMYSRIRR